ncbi:hypothetical protein F5Y10DRAFT_285429 [Nemania abortiva]|nr:hypothetical protein F5Y10DRAFT_285429 [Nemania abortiva]
MPRRRDKHSRRGKIRGTYTIHDKLTNRELDILYKALSCLMGITDDGQGKIDLRKLALDTGYEGPESARAAWNRIKKKLADNSAAVDAARAALNAFDSDSEEDSPEDLEQDNMSDDQDVEDDADGHAGPAKRARTYWARVPIIKEEEVEEDWGVSSQDHTYNPEAANPENVNPGQTVHYAEEADPPVFQYGNNTGASSQFNFNLIDHNLVAQRSWDEVAQRAFDEGQINDGFGPGGVFGEGTLPPLPPPGYSFGMGSYVNYNDDEIPTFNLWDSLGRLE